MKISSKSILSPGRAARDHPPISLSTSLSRRLLRPNGSIKGGQASPMFPTGNRKRGSGFENPEPSSPKVTCIGQVRVKTKKKGKQARTLSRRRSGEVSFRRLEQQVQSRDRQQPSQNDDQLCTTQRFLPMNASGTPYQQQTQDCLPHRNQRWVHLPITICEALRAFGAEFSCLFPCRSSCSSANDRDKEKKVTGSGEGNGQSSCGAVLAKWLVALQDGEGGKSREIELVVGGDEERTEVTGRTLRSSRRHVFDDFEITDEKYEVKDEIMEREEARVSICIPPKNALLLMRCRSDPTRVAALANRYLEKPTTIDEDCDERRQKINEDDAEQVDLGEREPGILCTVVNEELEAIDEMVSVEVEEENEKTDSEKALSMEAPADEEEEDTVQKSDETLQGEEQERQENVEETGMNQTSLCEEEIEASESSSGTHVVQESLENEEENRFQDNKCGEKRSSNVSLSSTILSDEEAAETEEELTSAVEAAVEEKEEDDDGETEAEAEKLTVEKETIEMPSEEEQEQTVTQPEEKTHEDKEEEELPVMESKERETESELRSEVTETMEDQESSKSSTSSTVALPDCLLLMMCEPKLSMEVSKETWVCRRDFLRWLPERPVNKKKGSDDANSKKRANNDSDSKPNLNADHQPQLTNPLPPRSSCSFPTAASMAGASMATMIEQKLVNAVAYEPFVLTRCKSEPMRTATKLAAETAFWKNNKLEPHRGASFGVGAAEIGF